MDALSDVPVDAAQDRQFDQTFELLRELVDLRHADNLQPLAPSAIYLASTVLWLLVYQRLQPGATLETTVQYLREIAPRLFPDHRRVREQTLSGSTAAYSGARQWLKEETVEWFATTVSQSIWQAAPPTLGNRRVFLLDGTTLTLAPEKSLRALYPPASNQHGQSAWPVALMVVTHELESGCALQPEIGAMYGPQAVSEVELARACFKRLPLSSVVLADAGFGIFSVAWAATKAGHSFLLRLTNQRFQALVKRGTRVAGGPGWNTFSLVWKPSAKDRQSNPWIPADAELTLRLHALTMPGGGPLYLLTDLTEDAATLGAVYYKRMDVETDISNIKIVLDMEHMRARTPAMFHKELLTSMVAYNLVVQFRRQAARLAKVPPRRLSFTSVWTTFRIMLLPTQSMDAATWRTRYRLALHYAMRSKLPNRPGRSYPREAYRRTSKSTHFKKRHTPP
jgi:hypothetical protein